MGNSTESDLVSDTAHTDLQTNRRKTSTTTDGQGRCWMAAASALRPRFEFLASFRQLQATGKARQGAENVKTNTINKCRLWLLLLLLLLLSRL